MRSLSIRLRLTLCYSAVLMLGLSLFGYGMWLALQQRLIAGVDGRLERQAEGLRLALEAEDLAADPGPFHEEIAECVKGMPAYAATPEAAVTPGTTSNAICWPASVSISSPPRPKMNGSPPFSRTTRLRCRASCTSKSLIDRCGLRA